AGPAARLARGGELGRYRILHFASHAVADPLDAARSGVVVGAGPHGAPAWLRSAEVRRLDLRADLVVLSGCRTALGRELRGEGLLGLAHAFFDAGASSLAVGLWDLQDRSAAQLVDRFYRALLERGRPPAAALRDAQLELAGDARWSAPVHWAGLLLQGDGWSDPLRHPPNKETR
ncbi:MAG TPA: CHAT domain-containing protein, partial [Thermoanaerobaculia bacterium]|nr:CHAT domain-containing protein [Thermoanaerobaculia bacterium]